MADIYVSGVRLTEEQVWWLDGFAQYGWDDFVVERDILKALWCALPVGSSEEDQP